MSIPFFLQAAIVRVMKHRKVLKHNQLIEEVHITIAIFCISALSKEASRLCGRVVENCVPVYFQFNSLSVACYDCAHCIFSLITR